MRDTLDINDSSEKIDIKVDCIVGQTKAFKETDE